MGKSTEYYQNNKAARDKKQAYDKKHNATKSATKKRVEANRANRIAQKNGTAKKGDNKDYDHAVKRMVPESTNRGRAEKSRLRGSKRSL